MTDIVRDLDGLNSQTKLRGNSIIRRSDTTSPYPPRIHSFTKPS